MEAGSGSEQAWAAGSGRGAAVGCGEGRGLLALVSSRVERRRHGELRSPALMVGDGVVLCAGKQGLDSGSARVERGWGEALVRDANEGGQSSAVRPGELEDPALGSALMASGVATALSPSARRVVACGGAEAQQRCRQGSSKAVLSWWRQRAGLRAGHAGRGVIGSALGKQGSRAEEGERREGERE